MVRTCFALVAGLLALAGMTLARPEEHGEGKPSVKALSAADIAEKIDGKKAKATTVEVTLGPGQASAQHRHPGPVFGYVLEGEYEWAIDDNPTRTLRAGTASKAPTTWPRITPPERTVEMPKSVSPTRRPPRLLRPGKHPVL